MTCFQTIHYECRGSITKFLYVNDKKFVGAENRLHWFEFKDKLLVNTNGIELYSITPISAVFNQARDELVIATKSDIRIINMFSGKIIKILANVKYPNTDLTQLKMYLNHKKIILGDNKGHITIYDQTNGNVYCQNIGHNGEISCLEVDHMNKMIIS